jgi:membrane protein insertase Oxa1/YidC/SpoIIIJ
LYCDLQLIRAPALSPVPPLDRFSDFTVPDPFIGLPLITAASMVLSIKYGSDTASSPNAAMQHKVKYALYGVSALSLWWTKDFPAAVCFYWMCQNLMSVTTGLILRNQNVRAFLNIPKPYVPPVKKTNERTSDESV